MSQTSQGGTLKKIKLLVPILKCIYLRGIGSIFVVSGAPWLRPFVLHIDFVIVLVRTSGSREYQILLYGSEK